MKQNFDNYRDTTEIILGKRVILITHKRDCLIKKSDMNIKQVIIDRLRATKRENIEMVIDYMENNAPSFWNARRLLFFTR
jgi:hypothetical protein